MGKAAPPLMSDEVLEGEADPKLTSDNDQES
jgi:hypothetical protein